MENIRSLQQLLCQWRYGIDLLLNHCRLVDDARFSSSLIIHLAGVLCWYQVRNHFLCTRQKYFYRCSTFTLVSFIYVNLYSLFGYSHLQRRMCECSNTIKLSLATTIAKVAVDADYCYSRIQPSAISNPKTRKHH